MPTKNFLRVLLLQVPTDQEDIMKLDTRYSCYGTGEYMKGEGFTIYRTVCYGSLFQIGWLQKKYNGRIDMPTAKDVLTLVRGMVADTKEEMRGRDWVDASELIADLFDDVENILI